MSKYKLPLNKCKEFNIIPWVCLGLETKINWFIYVADNHIFPYYYYSFYLAPWFLMSQTGLLWTIFYNFLIYFIVSEIHNQRQIELIHWIIFQKIAKTIILYIFIVILEKIIKQETMKREK